MNTLHSLSGNLYRDNGGLSATKLELIRKNYDTCHKTIKNVADMKATLRHGKYTWPGGYPLYFTTSDGAALSFESARENFYQICYSIRNNIDDGWKVVGVDVNYEDNNLYCDHSGEKIKCGYGK